MTDSLSRSGQGGMTAQFKIDDGTVTSPGLQFTAEANSGLYRALAFDVRMAIGGVDLMRWTTADGTQLWDGAVWKSLIFDAPVDGEYYSRSDNAWAIDPAIVQNTADIVTNADQIAQNIVNISTNATNIATNAANIDTKIGEAPEDATPYNRQDATWVPAVGGVSEAPIDGTIYGRQDAAWIATPGGADPNDLITAQTWAANVLTATRVTGDFTTTIEVFDSFKSNGPIRHVSAAVTTTVNPVNGGRYTLAATTQNLNFIAPTGIDTDLGENYEVEGSVLITNTGTDTITLQQDGAPVAAGDILGSQPTASGAKYLLTYIIHRAAGDAYNPLYIWSA
jgi:hypothetical protein